MLIPFGRKPFSKKNLCNQKLSTHYRPHRFVEFSSVTIWSWLFLIWHSEQDFPHFLSCDILYQVLFFHIRATIVQKVLQLWYFYACEICRFVLQEFSEMLLSFCFNIQRWSNHTPISTLYLFDGVNYFPGCSTSIEKLYYSYLPHLTNTSLIFALKPFPQALKQNPSACMLRFQPPCSVLLDFLLSHPAWDKDPQTRLLTLQRDFQAFSSPTPV